MQINDAALRKTYRENDAAIAQLRNFLANSGTAADSVQLRGVQATIKRIAARRGYEEFAGLASARRPAAPAKGGFNDIATVLIHKLQTESDAIVLVDQRRRRESPQPIVARPASVTPR